MLVRATTGWDAESRGPEVGRLPRMRLLVSLLLLVLGSTVPACAELELLTQGSGGGPGPPPSGSLSVSFIDVGQGDSVLVADAGANAVLRVNRATGRTTTWFLPPLITTGACEGAENNPGTVGCDPVPTEITEGPDGRIYVGTLSAEAPGAARVYVLDQRGQGSTSSSG